MRPDGSYVRGEPAEEEIGPAALGTHALVDGFDPIGGAAVLPRSNNDKSLIHAYFPISTTPLVCDASVPTEREISLASLALSRMTASRHDH